MGNKISMGDINEKLGYPRNTRSSLGQPEFRALANVPEGEIAISDFIGIVNVEINEPDLSDPNAEFITTVLKRGRNGWVGEGTQVSDAHPYLGETGNMGYNVVGDNDCITVGRAKTGETGHGIAQRETCVNGNSTGLLQVPICKSEYEQSETDASVRSTRMGTMYPNASYSRWYGINPIDSYYGHSQWQNLAMYYTDNQGLTSTEIFHEMGEDSNNPLYIIAPTSRDGDSNNRDFIVVDNGGKFYWTPDLGDLGLYEKLDMEMKDPVFFSDDGSDYGLQQHFCSMKDRNNFAVADSNNLYIIRNGNMFVDSLQGVESCYWNLLTDDVIVATSGSFNPNNRPRILRYDSSNVSNVVWALTDDDIGTVPYVIYNSKGAMVSTYQKYGDDGIVQYDKNWKVTRRHEDTYFLQTPFSGHWQRDDTMGFFFGGDYKYVGDVYVSDVHFTRFNPVSHLSKSKRAETIRRTDAFVLLNPQHAKRWAKVRVGLLLI